MSPQCLYLSHIVSNVQIHVDTHDELNQILSEGDVLVDNGQVERPTGGRKERLSLTVTR